MHFIIRRKKLAKTKPPLSLFEFLHCCEKSIDLEEPSLISVTYIFNLEQPIYVDLVTYVKQSANPFAIFFVINNMEL